MKEMEKALLKMIAEGGGPKKQKRRITPTKPTMKLVDVGTVSHALMQHYGWETYRIEGNLALMFWQGK